MIRFLLSIVILFGLALPSVAIDVDVGTEAPALVRTLSQSETWPVGWVRLRGVVQPTASESPSGQRDDEILETERALVRINDQGLRVCVLLRLRTDWRVYLPKNLQDAYDNGQRLGLTYGKRVDAWEIDNEPDLGFVPESAERYTAYLKATYLGLTAGIAKTQKKTEGEPLEGRGSAPCILMGSLGLPPGIWLERFARNQGFSYTDGFTYHYYGYADDFSGVYRQFQDAVKQLTPQVSGFRSQVSEKSLPIFLTEIGYGMLGKMDRNIKEGRLRQWRWFKSVGEQAGSLRIEAPMAFYLLPYLEYDNLEFGLTALPGKTDGGSAEMAKQTGDLKSENWVAGGITYVPQDFGAASAEPWMRGIGTKIDGNEATPALAWWLWMRGAHRKPETGDLKPESSRSWTVSVPAPSPVVIDFLNGEGLSFVKRYNGSFVTATAPVAVKKASAVAEPMADKETAKTAPPKPTTDNQQPTTSAPVAPPRSEEFMIHVRTANGNLFEVYPTRRATEGWQHYLESEGNFTMSFYGRAELPWRFSENKPVSLVVAMNPKKLPAVYEFRRVRTIRLGEIQKAENGRLKAEDFRYGRGTVVLYNFSEKEISGKLVLPEGVGRVVPNAPVDDRGALGATRSTLEMLTLAPGERREIEVSIQVPADGFRRVEALVQFVPDDSSAPPARFVTSFMPDIGGMKAQVAAELLQPRAESAPLLAAANPGPVHGSRFAKPGQGNLNAQSNRQFIAERPRAAEETGVKLVADVPKLVAFGSERVTAEPTEDGFVITVSGPAPDRPQRTELEIPWPEGVEFRSDEFLSLEFRVRP